MKDKNSIDVKRTQKFMKSLMSISGKKTADTALNNFKLEFKTDRTIWFATDTEISYFCIDTTSLNSHEETFIINSKIFFNFLKKTKSKQLYLQKTSNAVAVLDGRNTLTLTTYAGKFPEKVIENFRIICQIDSQLLKKVIKPGMLNINEQNDGKFSLRMTRMHLIFLARDNRRLTLSKFAYNSMQEFHICLRLIAIEKILDLCETEGVMQISYNQQTNEYMFTVQNEYLIIKALPKVSIDYDLHCITRDFAFFTCNLPDIKEAINQAMILQTKFNNTITLCFQPTPEELEPITNDILNKNPILLRGADPLVAKFKGSIPTEEKSPNLTGVIQVNINYLEDVLKICHTDQISIFVHDRLKSITIKPLNLGPNFEIIHLIMAISK